MAPSIASQQGDKATVSHGEFTEAIKGEPGDAEKTIWQLINENRRAIIVTFFANCGSFLFGYDVLVQGAVTALPAFS